MKQTAVDFLLEELYKLAELSNFLNESDFRKARTMIFEKAKVMEMEQIIDAFFIGKNDGILMERYSEYQHLSPIEYYNETFKSK